MSELSPNLREDDLCYPEDEEIPSLTADDIEAAYERALQALNAAEEAISVDNDGGSDVETSSESGPEKVATEPENSSLETHSTSHVNPLKNQDEQGIVIEQQESLIQPRQVIEAALFVGGSSLTSKRLGAMLGDDSSADEIEELVADLNSQYDDEHRPYEIRLGEGGYHLVLRDEFRPVQDRVHGTSPKDVKLSQEALEVLAYIAYRQPVSKEGLDETGKPNAASLVRQLLRRQLVCLERGEGSSEDVTYRTTPRFLELFGLRSLRELPLPEDLMLK
ncbi:MAG: SMC-Scp complex subunit ScpB [Planctomycetaceae bacterium]